MQMMDLKSQARHRARGSVQTTATIQVFPNHFPILKALPMMILRVL